MKKLYGALILAYIGYQQIMEYNTDVISIVVLLCIVLLYILKEKFYDTSPATFLFFITSLGLFTYNHDFILLTCIVIIDFLNKGKYVVALLLAIPAGYLSIYSQNDINVFFLISSALFGYAVGMKERNESLHNSTLDEERRLRYNLEQTQHQLLTTRNEIEHMTEIRERNRIAHEIHDNIGHSIAGVIFQIEGARRVIKKDIEKTEEILKLCSEKLSEALELARNTVYNIRADKKLGIDLIDEMISDYKFCKIDFEHTGDFSKINATNMIILEANLMELLTNATKYSKANYIKIKIDISRRNIRVYYKDNGIGCECIKESLGITGMRDRIRNAGGTFSIDGNQGFLVVFNLPILQTFGEEE